MNSISTPIMLTIRQTSERSGLARHYIRRLCLQNEIVYRKSGNKYLINYDKFVEYLNTKNPAPTHTDGT